MVALHKTARSSNVHPSKLAKLDEAPAASNVVVQFQSDTGDTVGEAAAADVGMQLHHLGHGGLSSCWPPSCT